MVFLIKQHAAYAVLLGVTLASTAIHNERKTRRILAVLSKGISRWQYVAGMLMGTASVLVTYIACLGVVGSALLSRVEISSGEGWRVLGIAALATLLS